MCFFAPQGLEKSLDDHKILLLEAAPDRPQKITSVYSNRVSNITPGSKRVLESKCYLMIILGKISAQPHTTLCIQLLDRENNGKNNRLPLGKQICLQ